MEANRRPKHAMIRLFAKDFVRKKLRFVDAVRSPLAPILAGIAAFLLLWPLSWLPLITATPAVVFAFGCAFGTASLTEAGPAGAYAIIFGDG